jgi:hypothetical protein
MTAQSPDEDTVDDYAYLDDVTAVCDEGRTEDVINEMGAALQKAGLHSNTAKLVVWTASGAPPEGKLASAAWQRQDRHDGFTLLGAPLGDEFDEDGRAHALPCGTQGYIDEWLARRKQGAQATAQILADIAPRCSWDVPAKQAMSQLVRQTFAQKHAHVARALWGPSARKFLQEVDGYAADLFVRVNGLPALADWQRDLLHEPVNEGGMGMPPLATTHAAAYLGAAAAHPGKALMGDVRAAIEEAAREFEADAGKTIQGATGLTADGLDGAGQRKVQRTLARHLVRARTAQFRTSLTAERRCWVEAASVGKGADAETAPGASEWLYALPTCPQTTLYNRQWLTAVGLRMMLVVAPVGSTCEVSPSSSSTPCGARLDERGWHAFDCARAAVQGRHDEWTRMWAEAAREAGCRAATEQIAAELALPRHATRARADVRVEGLGPWPVFWDILVTATPHQKEGCWHVSGCGVRVAAAERRKLTEWALPKQAGSSLAPIVAETQGRWGPRAVQALRELAAAAAQHSKELPAAEADRGVSAAFLRRWRCRLSVALQRANARAVLHARGIAGTRRASPW